MAQGVKVSRRQYAVGRYALCSLLLSTIVSAVKFFNKNSYLHLHPHCACPACRTGTFPLISLRDELSLGLSLIIRVPHDSTGFGGELSRTELVKVHDLEPVDGSKGQGQSLFDQAGLRGLHHPQFRYPRKDLTGAENVINLSICLIL